MMTRIVKVALILAGIAAILAAILVTPRFAAEYIFSDHHITPRELQELGTYRLFALIAGCLFLALGIVGSVLKQPLTSLLKGRLGRLDAKLASRLMLLIVALVFLITLGRPSLFCSNQNTYFPHGLRLAGREYLKNDWYSQTRSLHITFSLLIAALDSLGVLVEAVGLLEIALSLVLLLSLWLLSVALYHELSHSAESMREIVREQHFAVVVLGVFVLNVNLGVRVGTKIFELMNLDTLANGWRSLWSLGGVAGQYVFGRYLQPSEFGILVLLALTAVAYRRWKLSAFLFGIGSLFHISYVPHCAVFVAIIASWLAVHDERTTALHVVAVFSVIVSPLVIYSATMMMGNHTAEAAKILANQRIPHHALPSRWWGKGDALKLTVMSLATLVLVFRTRGALRWVFSIGTLYTALSIWVVMQTGNERLGLLFPWRASGFLYPISLVILLSTTMFYSVRLLIQENADLWYALLIGTLAVLTVAGLAKSGELLLGMQRQSGSYEQSGEQFYSQVRSQTSTEDIILIPTKLSEFRLKAQRAIYVDWKSHPYLPSEFLGWWARIQFVEAFYESNERERQVMCRQAGTDYYVLEIEDVTAAEEVVLAAGGYALIRCLNGG